MTRSQHWIRLYCNSCGAPFDSREPTKRFCSHPCGVAFGNRYRKNFKSGRPPRRQAEALEVLREAPGTWVPGRAIAMRLYSLDDKAAITALYYVMARLRQTWADLGLVIETRQPHSIECLEYRLVRDFVHDLAAVS